MIVTDVPISLLDPETATVTGYSDSGWLSMEVGLGIAICCNALEWLFVGLENAGAVRHTLV